MTLVNVVIEFIKIAKFLSIFLYHITRTLSLGFATRIGCSDGQAGLCLCFFVCNKFCFSCDGIHI